MNELTSTYNLIFVAGNTTFDSLCRTVGRSICLSVTLLVLVHANGLYYPCPDHDCPCPTARDRSCLSYFVRLGEHFLKFFRPDFGLMRSLGERAHFENGVFHRQSIRRRLKQRVTSRVQQLLIPIRLEPAPHSLRLPKLRPIF